MDMCSSGSIVATRCCTGKKVMCEEKEGIYYLLLYASLFLGRWNDDLSTLDVIDRFIASKYLRREISI